MLSLVSPTSSGPHGRPGKPAARRAARARRDALPAAARARASAKVAATAALAIAARVPAGSVVALYAAKGSEVDTAALETALHAAGFTTAYPRVVAETRVLALHVARLAELGIAGHLGLREPVATTPEVAPAAIAAFCIPGLAFDRAGGRIGWGLGHYDATLAAAPTALRIGLAFDAQLVADVPREAHDILLHALVTESGLHEVGA